VSEATPAGLHKLAHDMLETSDSAAQLGNQRNRLAALGKPRCRDYFNCGDAAAEEKQAKHIGLELL